MAAMSDPNSDCQSSEQPIRASPLIFHVKTQRVAAVSDPHSGCQSSEHLELIRVSQLVIWKPNKWLPCLTHRPKSKRAKAWWIFLTKPYDLYALIWWQEILVGIKRGKLPLFQTGRKTPITYFHFNAGIRLTSLCLLLVNAVPCGGQIESLWGL